MKRNILNKFVICGCLTLSAFLIACEDYLTIMPTNQIVEEDFWQDKRDLENVVAACYKRLISSDLMTKYIVCGEMRSDNFTLASGNTNEDITNLMNANLLPSSKMFTWVEFYNEINYCNKVLSHGPVIVERDASFSKGDWTPIEAEMMTLRALMHFMLVRCWGEVPYVSVDYNNNSQNFMLRQSTQQEVLDSIILDLEYAKTFAMNDYGKTVWNKGRITKKAVYALLADVYLWRASKNSSEDSIAKYGNMYIEDYNKCIECCDWILNTMKEERIKQLNKDGAVLGGVDEDEFTIEDLLIPNEETPNDKFSTTIGAHSAIFGKGNSQESIFELQFDGTNNANSTVTSYFAAISGEGSGTLVIPEGMVNSVDLTPNVQFPTCVYTKTDYRRWETVKYNSADQTDYPCGKYASSSISQTNGSAASTTFTDNNANNINIQNTARSTPCAANWILYRLSDIMLMKAEALSQITEDQDSLYQAFLLCKYIFKRSNPYAYTSSNRTAKDDSLKFDAFNSQHGIEALVMAERQREFIGEGKRWYDLVRYAQRRGSTSEMLRSYLGRKFAENQNAVFAKMNKMQTLFFPVQEDELKNNKLLHQNDVWSEDDYLKRTDEL